MMDAAEFLSDMLGEFRFIKSPAGKCGRETVKGLAEDFRALDESETGVMTAA